MIVTMTTMSMTTLAMERMRTNMKMTRMTGEEEDIHHVVGEVQVEVEVARDGDLAAWILSNAAALGAWVDRLLRDRMVMNFTKASVAAAVKTFERNMVLNSMRVLADVVDNAIVTSTVLSSMKVSAAGVVK